MIALLVCFIVLVIPLNVLSLWMKARVNEELPDDQQLSLLSRDYSKVNRLYGEQHPDSILPSLNGYGYYLAVALMAAMILLGFTSRS
ncbi:MAG: hypothetical protein WCC99_05325 [Candidatus Sulfotelmatobacter sp.]